MSNILASPKTAYVTMVKTVKTERFVVVWQRG